MNKEEKEAIEILNSQLLKSDGYDRHQKAIDIILKLIEKQQKEIESVGDTKYKRLLFSIRMLHFHHYINDTQFEKMIKKLSNEGE